MIRKHVAPNSVIYTDEFPTYSAIPKMKLLSGKGGTPANYKHFTIRHASGVYA